MPERHRLSKQDYEVQYGVDSKGSFGLPASLNALMLQELLVCNHRACEKERFSQGSYFTNSYLEAKIWRLRATHENHIGKKVYVFAEICPKCMLPEWPAIQVEAYVSYNDGSVVNKCQCENCGVEVFTAQDLLDRHGLYGSLIIGNSSRGHVSVGGKQRQD